jgi:hypothetical protein
MNFTYNTDSIQTIQKSDVTFLDAGIHENITLTAVRIDKTVNGVDFLELTFINDEGKTLKQTEFEPSRFPGSDDKAWERTIAIKVSRLMDYVYLYYPKGSLKNETNTYGEFIKWVAELLSKVDDNIKLRIKAVYQPNGFVTLPRYNDKTFIERMDVEKSSIVKVARDVFERPIIIPKTEDFSKVQSGEAYFTATTETEMPF